MTALDPAAVDALLTRARRDVEEGLLPSCQLALALDGEVLVHEAFGAATTASRYTMFSATKPVVASVIWQLLGEGVLDPETPVAELIPEFGTNGKDVITLDHVLLHTSGFPRAPLGPPQWDTHEGRREAFARWRLSWEVGSRYEYHPTSAHWVLAEVIHAVTGEDHRDAVRRRVTEPLGLTALSVGVPPAEQGDILDVVLCGEPASPDELEAALGVRSIDVGEVTDEALLSLSRPAARAVGLPGGGGISNAADLASFYQALLHDPKGLWDPDVLRDVTSVVRNTFPDPMLGVPANRTRGLIVAGDDGRSHLRGMGRTVSPATFGHNGAAGQVAWADPASGLSFAYLTNGRDLHLLREHRRTTALASLAASCVA
jgi:CubicO group peptidase (beta-lactamase class C family)